MTPSDIALFSMLWMIVGNAVVVGCFGARWIIDEMRAGSPTIFGLAFFVVFWPILLMLHLRDWLSR